MLKILDEIKHFGQEGLTASDLVGKFADEDMTAREKRNLYNRTYRNLLALISINKLKREPVQGDKIIFYKYKLAI